VLDEMLKRVAVLGAAGKMGRGISLLLLEQIALLEAEQTGRIGFGNYRLILVDTNEKAFDALFTYLKSQLVRFAEKNGKLLQAYLFHSKENQKNFVERAMKIVRMETSTEAAGEAGLIFEAVAEDVDCKVDALSRIEATSFGKPYFFTNTSCIPIHLLDEKARLDGRIIGFHFYNPPPVQKLLEIIPSKTTISKLKEDAMVLAKRMAKVTVISKDVSGFIGNGYFMREIDYACRKVKELEKERTRKEAVWMVNQVTQDFLVRPMGIFQLLDYVGLDVCRKVMEIMKTHLNIDFEMDIIETYIGTGRKGGQHPDGSQREGIFYYDKGEVKKIWDFGEYANLPSELLDPPPQGHLSWKTIHKKTDKNSILRHFFKDLFASKTPAAILTMEHLCQSRAIARKLVGEGVAHTMDDVNTVLKNGFYHLYGANCPWVPEW